MDLTLLDKLRKTKAWRKEEQRFLEYDGCSVLPPSWQCTYHRKKKKKDLKDFFDKIKRETKSKR